MYITHNGNAVDVLGFTDFINRGGIYCARIENKGTSGSPNYVVKDGYGGLSPSELSDSLEAFDFTAKIDAELGDDAWRTGSGSGELTTDPLTLAESDIVALYSTPIQIKAAPGTDIVDDPTTAWAYVNFISAYTANTTLNLVSGATILGTCNCLGATSSGWFKFTMNGNKPETNAVLSVAAATANPTGGTSQVGVTVGYVQKDKSIFTFPAYIWANGFDSWALTNPNSSHLSFTRSSGSATATHDGAESTTLSANNNENPTALSVSANHVYFRFTLAQTGQATNVPRGAVARTSDGTRVVLVINNYLVGDGTPDTVLRTTLSGVNQDTSLTGESIAGEWYMDIEENQQRFYRWNGSSWVLKATHTRAFGAQTYKLRLGCANAATGSNAAGSVTMSEAYGTYNSFTGRLPT
jgi:hypothetical protein